MKLALTTLGLAMGLLATSAMAQDYTLSGGGISEEQITRGEDAFMTNCAGCHGDDLRAIDSNAPDLRGPSFRSAWTGQPLNEKFETIVATMPPGQGGSLGDQTYADIVAFILSTNGVPTTEGELPGDAGALADYTVTEN